MPLETATYVADLNPSNPAHTDQLNQADAHARLIKSVLKATFPNFTSGALTSTQADLDAAAGIAAGTSPTTIPMGSASAPGLRVAGDSNTGIYSPAADTLAVAVGGAQAVEITPDKKVAMKGAASVAGALAVAGAYTGGTGQLVPIGGTLLWWEDTLPAEGGYAWANGQIIANANIVCPVLVARWGDRFGGNGVTTMGVPDLRDNVPVGKSTMGSTSAAGRIVSGVTGFVSSTLGAIFGAAMHTLTSAQIAGHTHPAVVTDPGHKHTSRQGNVAGANITVTNGDGTPGTNGNVGTWESAPATTGITVATQNNVGGDQAHNNVQPSVVCNYIIRIA